MTRNKTGKPVKTQQAVRLAERTAKLVFDNSDVFPEMDIPDTTEFGDIEDMSLLEAVPAGKMPQGISLRRGLEMMEQNGK